LILIVILGFGKNQEFYEEMEKSLVPFFEKLIRKNREDCVIIISGWRGEAEWVKNFLIKKNISSKNMYLEKEACMTSENISFVFKKLLTSNGGWPNFNQINEIIFIGEKGSKKEVFWLAPRIYSRMTAGKKCLKRIAFFPLKLLNYRDRKKKEKRIIFSKIAFYFPVFHTFLRALRRKDII
jgi:hypothetical protein